MPNLDEIKMQLKNLDGGSKALAFREIKYLPQALAADEDVQAAIQGYYENRNGLLVATKRRLLFVDRGLISGVRVEEFPYKSISSVKYETGMMFGTIRVFVSGNTAEISYLDKAQTRSFVARLDELRNGPSPIAVPPPMPTAAPARAKDSDQMIERLQKLTDLHKSGALSDDEFRAAKAKLLG